MDEQIKNIKQKYSYVTIEEILDETTDIDTGETETSIEYVVSNFNGNKNISVKLDKKEELEGLDFVLSKNVTLLDEFLGFNIMMCMKL